MPRPEPVLLTPLVLCLFLLLDAPTFAQWLPRGATPRGVVVAFLDETSRSDTAVDRAAFSVRLSGELADVDPRSFRGTLPDGARFRIDSIPDLPVDPEADEDVTRRAVAFVTLRTSTDVENCSVFLRRDTMWTIEAIRRLPETAVRPKLRAAIAALDTSIPSNSIRRGDLERLLLSEDSLAALLRAWAPTVEKVVAPLRTSKRWSAMALREVDFAKLEEYRELDDDVPAPELIFYTLDRGALERLKRGLGIRRITRDRRYPNLLFLEAAAIERSHYGYVNAPGAAALPPLSPDEFIVLKPAADGWWVYKRRIED